jgi:putative endonuclease
MLECGDGTLYTGVTFDLDRRLVEHQAGRGGGYTSAHRPVRMVYREPCDSMGVALRREAEIKRMGRTRKLRLIEEHHKEEHND